MDFQTVCLGILSFGEASGYDIKQRFERTYRHFFAAGYGSIYPALARLAEEGLVICREVPGRGAHARKLYSLTAAGRCELQARLATVPPRHRVRSEFMMLMFLADHLKPERVEAIIGERLEEIRAHLAYLAGGGPGKVRNRAGTEFTRGLGLAILDATARYLETHREAFLSALRVQQREEIRQFDAASTGDRA